VNNTFKVNSHMLNRPGRIFYHIRYRGLEQAAVREYCADNLKDPTQLDGLLEVAGTLDSFNFDMLKALVEEMNRYSETAKQSAQMLNMRPESVSYVKWELSGQKDGAGRKKPVPADDTHWEGGHPLTVGKLAILQFYNNTANFRDQLTKQDLLLQTPEKLVFQKDGYTLTFNRRVTQEYAY